MSSVGVLYGFGRVFPPKTGRHVPKYTKLSAHCLTCTAPRVLKRVFDGPRGGTRENNHFTGMCCGTEAGSYLRLIDSCITQLKAQGASRTCNESKEEEDEFGGDTISVNISVTLLPVQ